MQLNKCLIFDIERTRHFHKTFFLSTEALFSPCLFPLLVFAGLDVPCTFELFVGVSDGFFGVPSTKNTAIIL